MFVSSYYYIVLNLTNAVLSKTIFGSILVSYDGVLCAKEIHRLGPTDLKIYTLAKKLATVTRQLTKSIDFRQIYLCDFHLWAVAASRSFCWRMINLWTYDKEANCFFSGSCSPTLLRVLETNDLKTPSSWRWKRTRLFTLQLHKQAVDCSEDTAEERGGKRTSGQQGNAKGRGGDELPSTHGAAT